MINRVLILALISCTNAFAEQPSPSRAAKPPLSISGIHPHLTVYGIYSQNGAHLKPRHEECGIGAVVPWAGKLWMVNYAPHMPHGSEHKLFSITDDLQLTVHEESVGGTPAGRMIHEESQQLFIAHYAISKDGNIRVIPIDKMPMRVTAITRHLKDPENMVHYIDMEGSIWEVNVHSLDAKQLFKKPVPGWHGKGGYVSQGRLVISNNGELAAGSYDDVLVGGSPKHPEERGVLAEFDGKDWSVVERRQYTEVTGPNGLAGGSDGNEPIWAIGWDKRSLRLKLLEDGTWHTYLLPKSSFCNDASHGWYTEWPRIREITDGRWMMDMHGMFFDFPKNFSARNSAGLAPIASHLRYIPDFCAWNGKLVLASDETSIQGNHLAGQPQTNLWFGDYEDLKTWGPASAYGGPWIEDSVVANTPSDPFLVAGFDRRVLHLAVGSKTATDSPIMRATGSLPIKQIPESLARLPRVTVERGDWKQPANGYQFKVNQPVTVYLAVDKRGNPSLPSDWKQTDLALVWGDSYQDVVYQRDFSAGTVDIPGNTVEHIPGSFGMPHTAFVKGSSSSLAMKGESLVTIEFPQARKQPPTARKADPVVFTVQQDINGDGTWSDYAQITVDQDGYVHHLFPVDFQAKWLRLMTDRDCIATASVHQTTSRFHDGTGNADLFDGLADADSSESQAALVYPAKLNRNLRVVKPVGQQFDFTKSDFEFHRVDPDRQIADLLDVEPEFSVDDASVIVVHEGVRLRLPKGNGVFDRPFPAGWPRAIREVESERHLANIHGTFYEVPLVTNGKPAAFHLARPIASHNKQIADFCSWNGLLVLTGVSLAAKADDHVFIDAARGLGLWFGGVDDLWKLGKPVGTGGPWKESPVVGGHSSDPYLMTGYDKKTLWLESDKETTITIEVDIDHLSGWHVYKTLVLKAGKPISYVFPKSFSAHWIRFRSSVDCLATAQLSYE